ncbi:ankyrin repeat domain-containing protein [Rickettsia endosymbiont of Halotydeus destructor]|uniref:ankyrin repeat domain-containing protein n=1 Tax=Rickettsia endosymbiont of Halotydeus destructor TaxID=2996754 RepID=UPI003BB0ED57
MKEKELPLLLQRINSRCEAKEVEEILSKGVNINATDEVGKNALHYSVLNYLDVYADIIKVLIKDGININHSDAPGNTPLYYAAHLRNNIVVKLLIENGAKINITNTQGKKPIDIIQDRTEETAQILNIAELVDQFVEGKELNKINIKLLDDQWGKGIFLNRLQNIIDNKGLPYDLDAQKYSGTISSELSNKIEEKISLYSEANENLNILEANLLNRCEDLSPVPISLLKNQKFFLQEEGEKLEHFYNSNSQFKIPGNYLLDLVNNHYQTFIDFITAPEGRVILQQLLNISNENKVNKNIKDTIKRIAHHWENIELNTDFLSKYSLKETTEMLLGDEVKSIGDKNGFIEEE